MDLNKLVSTLAARPTVRRVVQCDGYAALPLVQFRGVNDDVIRQDTGVLSATLQAASLPPSFGTFEEVGRADGLTTLWDRVAEQLRPLAEITGVEGIFHVWSDEKTEVPVGFETRNDVFGNARVESGMTKYEERYLYPEGVYLIVLSSQSPETVEATNWLLERIDPDGKIDLMYVTHDELPEGAVQLV